jgi:hypothetical protein
MLSMLSIPSPQSLTPPRGSPRHDACRYVGTGNPGNRLGTPQGGPLSPLLSNLMLDVLDKEAAHAIRPAEVTASRHGQTSGKSQPLRPTPWLGISDSNFDVQGEYSSL